MRSQPVSPKELHHIRRRRGQAGQRPTSVVLDASVHERDVRVVQDGVISSAGVAAGIDMAFELVASLCGEEVARETARYIDYGWEPGG